MADAQATPQQGSSPSTEKRVSTEKSKSGGRGREPPSSQQRSLFPTQQSLKRERKKVVGKESVREPPATTATAKKVPSATTETNASSFAGGEADGASPKSVTGKGKEPAATAPLHEASSASVPSPASASAAPSPLTCASLGNPDKTKRAQRAVRRLSKIVSLSPAKAKGGSPPLPSKQQILQGIAGLDSRIRTRQTDREGAKADMKRAVRDEAAERERDEERRRKEEAAAEVARREAEERDRERRREEALEIKEKAKEKAKERAKEIQARLADL